MVRKRRSPRRHTVRKHKRGESTVREYNRGKTRPTTHRKRIKRYGRYFPERVFYEECRRLAKAHPSWSTTKIEAEATTRLLSLNKNPEKELDKAVYRCRRCKRHYRASIWGITQSSLCPGCGRRTLELLRL